MVYFECSAFSMATNLIDKNIVYLNYPSTYGSTPAMKKLDYITGTKRNKASLFKSVVKAILCLLLELLPLILKFHASF